MVKRKYPSELNTRSIRVNIGDWHLLNEMARRYDTTVAKVLHMAIGERARQDRVAVTPRTQIPMTLGTTVYQVKPVTAMATNGNKGVAFRIKPGSVRYV